MVVPIIILVVWVAFGGAAAATMHRRGRDTFAWAAVFLALGPLALPLAMSAERRPPPHEQLDARAAGVAGETGDVLQQYAGEHGYEVIVMGNSSPASAHLVRRRLAPKPSTGASVPVLIGPATR